MAKDNSTGKDKEFYDLGKKLFDRINPTIYRPIETKHDIKSDIDLLWRVNSADVEALEDASMALRIIKENEAGSYDQLIDQALESIDRALGMSHGEAMERVANAAIRAIRARGNT